MINFINLPFHLSIFPTVEYFIIILFYLFYFILQLMAHSLMQCDETGMLCFYWSTLLSIKLQWAGVETLVQSAPFTLHCPSDIRNMALRELASLEKYLGLKKPNKYSTQGDKKVT